MIIVGNPNVGKSVLFNKLTGSYATVSNYPGTTVELTKGTGRFNSYQLEVIDTPGAYSLLPITEEEKVTRSVLLEEKPKLVLHVIDAKNLERMLSFTLQLIEADMPTILVLNMLDELEETGKKINIEILESRLGIPVIGVVATTGKGIDILKKRIADYVGKTDENATSQQCAQFSIEAALTEIEQLLKSDYAFSKRSIALLLLQQDKEIEAIVREKENSTFEKIEKIIHNTRSCYCHPLHYIIAMQRQKRASEIARSVTEPVQIPRLTFAERLSRLTMNPITGIPILFLVLYVGFYKFVGGFGAGTLVDFLENTIFRCYINPFAEKLFSVIIPVPLIQDLFVGEYGIVTLGLRYAVAIILPIVAVFFLVFAIIEDTGYLPRLAMLIDRIFKKIGLSGRAVIPMVLGFGCDTMATMVTRTLPTKRERVIATMLLALAVPCSAQLGVIMAILAGKPLAILIWAGVIMLVFLFVGYLGAKLLPGEKPVFYMEVPPLRLPVLSNVLVKTYSRVVWYLKEIMPLFILVSAVIWVGQITKLFDFVISLMRIPVKLIGLPPEAAHIFVLGFFRRDYGAAGLYDLNTAGVLSGVQLVVASVALTLFLPCVAQLLINIKEHGIKTGINISLFVLAVSFLVSFALNYILAALGVVL